MRLSETDLVPIACDILVPRDLERAVPEQAQAIFHLAADLRLTHERLDSQSEVNVSGTSNVLKWALKKRCRRVLFMSSMAAYGIHRHRIDETTTSNAMEVPINYFRTKFLGELEVERWIDRGLDAVIVNPSIVVGPGDMANLPATYIRLVRNSSLPFTPHGSTSFCHVRDVARAMIACVERSTFLALGRLIEGIVGGRAPRLALPGPLFRGAAHATSLCATLLNRRTLMTPEVALAVSNDMLVDCAKAIRELDYRPAPLEEMFRDAAAWLEEKHLLDAKSPMLLAKRRDARLELSPNGNNQAKA